MSNGISSIYLLTSMFIKKNKTDIITSAVLPDEWFNATIGMFDILANIIYCVLFIKPIRDVYGSQRDMSDRSSITRKTLQVGFKVAILIASTFVASLIIAGAISESFTPLLFPIDLVLNAICLMLMTPYYPDRSYYFKLCSLCIFCCNWNEFNKSDHTKKDKKRLKHRKEKEKRNSNQNKHNSKLSPPLGAARHGRKASDNSFTESSLESSLNSSVDGLPGANAQAQSKSSENELQGMNDDVKIIAANDFSCLVYCSTSGEKCNEYNDFDELSNGNYMNVVTDETCENSTSSCLVNNEFKITHSLGDGTGSVFDTLSIMKTRDNYFNKIILENRDETFVIDNILKQKQPTHAEIVCKHFVLFLLIVILII